MTKRDQHQVAYAVVELADAVDELQSSAGKRAGGKDAADAPELVEQLHAQQEAIVAALELVRGASARLEERVAVSPGLPVAETAEYLGVSEPTVRAWLDREVLERLAGSKPILVERDSVRRAGRLLHELRDRGQDRDWMQALVDLLHDRVEVQRPEIARGLDELKRGKLEPA
jgi:predicted nucleic acid-binding protein